LERFSGFAAYSRLGKHTLYGQVSVLAHMVRVIWEPFTLPV
jgi:hypothetical protein